MTQKDIKTLIDNNLIIDITNKTREEAAEIQKEGGKLWRKITTYGQNGMNGALYLQEKTGKVYGIAARNYLLMIL